MSREERIIEILTKNLRPENLIVENESTSHHVPKNSETHFLVVVVSTAFSDLTKIERHRLINQLLTDELKNGLHALSMNLYTPSEWNKKSQTNFKSPPCRGGFNE